MVDIIQIVMENSELILLVISVVLAMVARYFQNEATSLKEAVQAVNTLSQTVLDSIKDGAVSQEELTDILAKIQIAKKEIQDVVDIIIPPPTLSEQIKTVFLGFRRPQVENFARKAQEFRMTKKFQ
jgi:ABC-type transporter MlaC component